MYQEHAKHSFFPISVINFYILPEMQDIKYKNQPPDYNLRVNW